MGGSGIPNGSIGREGLVGHGMAGQPGSGGLITVTYDPQTRPYLGMLRLPSWNGPKPVFMEQAVAGVVVSGGELWPTAHAHLSLNFF